MPQFLITAPDGTKYNVTGPEGATEEQALAQVQAQHTDAAAAAPAAAAPGSPPVSNGVNPDGSIPGREGNLDPAEAGDFWATHEVSRGGIPEHLVLPARPGDRPANDDTGFLGTAVDRYLKDGQHYGAFDSDEAGARFMQNAATLAHGHAGGDLANIRAGLQEGMTGLLGMVTDPLGGASHTLNQAWGRYNPEGVPADSTEEKLFRATGAGLPALALPSGSGTIAGKIIDNVLASVGGELSAESVPDFLKPIARILGGIITGNTRNAPAAARAVPGVINDAKAAASRATTHVFGPITQAQRDLSVGEKLQNTARDPDELRRTLGEGSQQTSEGYGYDPALPNSKPTTFQLTGDTGIGEQQRVVDKNFAADAADRRGAQTTAQRAALGNIQPEGNPTDLATYVKDQVRWLDRQTEQDIADATRVGQERTAALGGTRTPENQGAALRAPAQAAANASRERRSALWKAIDPDGTLVVAGNPVREQANAILAEHPTSALPISGAEKHVLDSASAYGNAVPFTEMTALRNTVNEAMAAEQLANGRSTQWGRLSLMRGAIERSMNSAIEHQAATIATTATPQARAAWIDNLANWRDTWEGNRAPRSSPVPQPAPAPAAPAPPAPESTPINDDIRDRYSAALQASTEHARTYTEGPVGEILASSGRQGEYKISNAGVPGTLWHQGPTGAETVTAYRQAVGDGQAMVDLQDAAAASLKNAAMKADGTLDPARTTAWMQQHKEALRAFPTLQDRFRNAASASEAIVESTATRRTVQDAAEAGMLGKLTGLRTPDDVTRAIGGIFGAQDRVGQMRDLVQTASRDPAALQGLRRAVADFISQKLVSNTEAGTSGVTQIKSDSFQTFVRQNDAALREVLTHEQVEGLHSIADNIQRGQRTVKLPGQSNTPQDFAAEAKGGMNSLLGAALKDIGSIGAGAVGALSHGVAGFMGGLASAKMYLAFREANITRSNELFRDAILNPEVAHELLVKLPPKPSAAFQAAHVARMRAALGLNVIRTGVPGLLGSGAAVNDDTGYQDQPYEPGLINQ
jgi:hypothetical protein